MRGALSTWRTFAGDALEQCEGANDRRRRRKEPSVDTECHEAVGQRVAGRVLSHYRGADAHAQARDDDSGALRLLSGMSEGVVPDEHDTLSIHPQVDRYFSISSAAVMVDLSFFSGP